MQVVRTDETPTKLKLVISAETADLEPIKRHTLSHFAGRIKVPGFRAGTAPATMLEKHVDPKELADEFIEHALNSLFRRAVDQEKLRPVASPQVSIKKFVPFTNLEFEAVVEVLGPIKLADYTKIKLARPTVKVTPAEVTDVLKSLQKQQAKRVDVTRPAKSGDEVLIDFKGVDSKGAPVNGADGKDYPLLLGSNTFIPGFEDNLIGVKAGQEKTFTIVFPADYGVAALQNKKVTFTVPVKKVSELSEPKADDDFAQKAGPFKNLAELKADIKKQISIEKERNAQGQYENELIAKIADKSTVEIPEFLVDDQVMRSEEEEKRNLTYRGQTWEEHLAQEGITEQQHRDRQRPGALNTIKASLILSEVAERENISVTPEELEVRVQLLKGQYQDPQMRAELDKPENRNEVGARLMTEKTIQKLIDYASKK